MALRAVLEAIEPLFEHSDARRPIRVHDLRATFVTVSLADGRTETWVADRTGHRSSEMINRYRRAARTWAELDLGALTPLDESVVENDSDVSGEGEIRTRGTLARPHDFQSCTFGHSVTSPKVLEN